MVVAVADLIRQFKEQQQFNVLVTERGEVHQTFADVQKLSDDSQALTAIRGNDRLSSIGKDEAIAKLAADSRAAIDSWHEAERSASTISLKYSHAKLQDAVTPRGSDDASQAGLRKEVRDAARGMDDAQRELLYRQGDPLVRRALEELPSVTKTKDGGVLVRPFVSDDIRRAALLDAGRVALPAMATAIDNTRAAEERFHILAGALRAEITKQIPDAFSNANGSQPSRHDLWLCPTGGLARADTARFEPPDPCVGFYGVAHRGFPWHHSDFGRVAG